MAGFFEPDDDDEIAKCAICATAFCLRNAKPIGFALLALAAVVLFLVYFRHA